LKIDELVKGLKGSNSEEKIHNYIILHPDEVYEYYDETLHKEFPELQEDSVNWYLWNLAKEKRIGKINIGRRVYFGSNEAIEELRKKLPKENKPKQ
jgi:hypothetical protein